MKAQFFLAISHIKGIAHMASVDELPQLEINFKSPRDAEGFVDVLREEFKILFPYTVSPHSNFINTIELQGIKIKIGVQK